MRAKNCKLHRIHEWGEKVTEINIFLRNRSPRHCSFIYFLCVWLLGGDFWISKKGVGTYVSWLWSKKKKWNAERNLWNPKNYEFIDESRIGVDEFGFEYAVSNRAEWVDFDKFLPFFCSSRNFNDFLRNICTLKIIKLQPQKEKSINTRAINFWKHEFKIFSHIFSQKLQ